MAGDVRVRRDLCFRGCCWVYSAWEPALKDSHAASIRDGGNRWGRVGTRHLLPEIDIRHHLPVTDGPPDHVDPRTAPVRARAEAVEAWYQPEWVRAAEAIRARHPELAEAEAYRGTITVKRPCPF